MADVGVEGARFKAATVIRPRLADTRALVATLAVALAGWIVAMQRMKGMDMGPGTALGTLPFFMGVWVTMMAAMMLPSALPMVLLFDRVGRERRAVGQDATPTSLFVGSYLLVWAGFGLAAYLVYRGIGLADLGVLSWDQDGRWFAGGAVALAGVFELSPLKHTCLRHCRSPLHYLLGGWRSGRLGALAMGAEHGAYCVGCCWGLMVILFALGVMSLTWMAIVTGFVFVQKVLPANVFADRAFACALIACGLWVALAPGTVPGLVTPM